MKTCGQCSVEKSLTEFYAVKRTGGYTSACKTCVRANSKKWKEANPDRYVKTLRDCRLRADFGMTVEQYDRLLNTQGGTCLICGFAPGGKRLHVDHDHETGAVRGLLCFRCNAGVGIFDKKNLIDRAIAYVRMGPS